MGYFGKLEEKELAIKLRKQGLSYKQILKKVKVSKSTLSLWCRDISLTVEQSEQLLKRKFEGSEKGRILGAKKNQERRIKETTEQFILGEKEIGKLTKRERFLIGIALYAGEGSKKRIGFANSDPKIIKFMMKWFKEFCEVPPEKFRGAIWIHDNLNAIEAKDFWSNTTGIPENQFYKTYIAKNKKTSKKIRKNIHQFGVFSISLSNTKTHRKILGWLSGILNPQLI